MSEALSFCAHCKGGTGGSVVSRLSGVVRSCSSSGVVWCHLSCHIAYRLVEKYSSHLKFVLNKYSLGFPAFIIFPMLLKFVGIWRAQETAGAFVYLFISMAFLSLLHANVILLWLPSKGPGPSLIITPEGYTTPLKKVSPRMQMWPPKCEPFSNIFSFQSVIKRCKQARSLGWWLIRWLDG